MLRWYSQVREMVRGLEKSPHAAFGYRAWALFGVIPLLLGLYEGPLVGTLLGTGHRWGWVAALAAVTGLSAVVAGGLFRTGAVRVAAATALWPFGVVVLAMAYPRASWRLARRGGLEWRGTFYSATILRQGLRPHGWGREGTLRQSLRRPGTGPRGRGRRGSDHQNLGPGPGPHGPRGPSYR
ncbi:hypothetical protein [Alicyclobacillus sp.]|uniref:hypothetical protein n=1 Tax=Alicyclobacillus sp. TaxID=61169 RepID=UPI0025C61497|nr:hypothetical protein [Alicyclobacillus sp.]MCL6515689.1 hypothetical protein [Alicyclobacillus sp.]